MKTKPGTPYPLGSTWNGHGVNFAIFSDNAEKIELCLFDSMDSKTESIRIELHEKDDNVWHASVEGLWPGQLYGYRVYGPYDPVRGMRFNPNKVLLDPYAKAIGRVIKWSDSMFGYTIGSQEDDLSFDTRDNAANAPLSVVVDEAFSWGDDQRPNIPWHKTSIYELHVKGFTKLNQSIPEDMRGTYAGLSSDQSIAHFKSLGITAIELMPVHYHANDRYLIEKGLSNYWGYNTLSFFAPDPRYTRYENPNETVREFKSMVRRLHKANLEVILDVVYNHTAEGNHLGPTLSLKGIDNSVYYRTVHDNHRYYMDYTGCGNTLNMQHPRVLQLIMDSLRYWVLEMHVDGFRFDLASALARELHEVDKLGAFFDIVRQDPVLSQVKLIAEPWDLGDGGYQVGNFPLGWTEWNGKYRDTVRKFWKGDPGVASEFATRISGSSDLYESSGRRPHASINFVTAHDGFTLRDLVSYNEKHNESNGEGNTDGESHNNSWNCGAEGPTDDLEINQLRERQARNFIATLFCSQGVPMLSHGDELGRTQNGNNNSYCQDNETSWMNWQTTSAGSRLLEFTRKVSTIWTNNPVFQRRKFLKGKVLLGNDIRDVIWLHHSGKELADWQWKKGNLRCFGIYLVGHAINDVDENGDRIFGDSFLCIFNASHVTVPFSLPPPQTGYQWIRVIDTWYNVQDNVCLRKGIRYGMRERSMVILQLKKVSAL